MKVIVDTNVPRTANLQADHASPDCVVRCARKLQEIQTQHIVVLDDAWRIIREYLRRLDPSGQPGPGDAFLKWVLTNQANPQRCERVRITPCTDVADERDFIELPHTPELARFDPSDRKFVAVALAHPEHPPILNATDSDWWHYREALAAHAVTVEFVCPDAAFMKELY